MFGSLGGGKLFVLTDIIVLGFNVGTGINFFLSWLAGGMVTPSSSTITAPLAGTTSPKGRDASAGCSGVVIGGCGTLESRIKFLHLVKGCELAGVSMNLQLDRMKQLIQDTILEVLYLHCFVERFNTVIHMECVEGVVGGHVGSRVLIETPVLRVTGAVELEVTKPLEGLLV